MPVRALAALCCFAAATVVPAQADPASIAVASSTAMLDFVRAASDAYGATHPDVAITVTGGGSAGAVRALSAGTIDVAVSDVAPDTGDPALVDHPVAVIAFAIVADPSAGVTSLTRRQLRDIFTGAVTNWKAVGGADKRLVVVGRSSRSGVTALVSRKLLDGAAVVDRGASAEATATALASAKAIPGALTVVSLGAARAAGLATVAIDGAEPTDENVENGSYPLWAYEHMITAGAPATPLSRFLSFIASDRTLLHRFGFIGVRELGAAARTP